jgi:two-component system, NarL family, nitrate/nitrite response regulator NarL
VTRTAEGRPRVRIVLVDDHALFREGLTRLLGAEPDLDIVGHCATVDEALEILSAGPVDLVLLDVDLGAQRGSEFMTRARRAGFAGRVLVVTAGLTDAEAARFLREGASGIFLKHDSPAVLVRSIRQVMDGEASVDHEILSGVLRMGTPPEEETAKAPLTERERGVLHGVLEGLANKEIAAELDISESSVKAALQQLFHKTGVRTRSQLVRIALEQYRDQL